MKKKCIMVVAVTLFLCASLFAQQYKPITLNTGAVGGLYMEPGIIWAEQWERAIPGLKTSVILGGAFTNPMLVAKADPNTSAGMSDTGNLVAALSGSGEYQSRVPNGIKNLKALWRFNVLSWAHIVARPEVVPAGVKTLGDFLAKKPKVRIALKVRGSTDEIFARQILTEMGYTYQDLEKWGCKITFNNPADISTLLIDGHADVTIGQVRSPASYVLDMDSSISELKWIGLDKPVADAVAKKYGYVIGYHPLGIYPSLKDNLWSLAIDHVIYVNEQMDTDLAYRLTKAVFSDPNKVKTLAAFASFDPKEIWKDTVYPLHPGAERAFKELGYMK
jgi:TRAP transporter TAXI family solute receptor